MVCGYSQGGGGGECPLPPPLNETLVIIITAIIHYDHVIYREVRVFLNCDHTAKVPVITTIGDAVIRHNYVSFHNHYISLQLMCNEPDAW